MRVPFVEKILIFLIAPRNYCLHALNFPVRQEWPPPTEKQIVIFVMKIEKKDKESHVIEHLLCAR